MPHISLTCTENLGALEGFTFDSLSRRPLRRILSGPPNVSNVTFQKLGVPYFGVLKIWILLFRVLY